MQTVRRTATNPDTGDKYQIELPAPAVIGQAILELPYSHYGMMPKKTTEILAEKLKLSEEQKNAGYKGGDNIFYYIVDEAFRVLLKEGKLQQPGGPRTPYFLENPPITDLSRVLEKILEIAIASAESDYIYRGEQECYDKVSSNLYRIRPTTEGTDFDINDFQNSILEKAKAYIGKTDNIDETDDIGILTELQHFDGRTNLIDFTENYLIALFFACNGSPDEAGRVILLKRESDDYAIRRPRRTTTRVESQRSVFVESPTGFVEPNIVVPIPAELKQPLLDYLRNSLGISVGTIYNDLHGFIRQSPYGDYLDGLASQRKAEEAKDSKEKHRHYENAIGHYTESLKLNPDFAKVYNNRAVSYQYTGDFDAAIQDCNKAIALNPEFVEAYTNRGLAYVDKEDLDAAIQDYTKVIELKPKYAIAYNNRGVAYYKKGELDMAVENYNEAIKLKPDYASPYNNRGAAYYQKGEFDMAIENYSEVIKSYPDYASPYNNRGAAYHQKGEFDMAIENYNEAIKLKSDYADAYSNRGNAWLALSEWENAKADLITAQNIGTDIVASFHNDYESVEDFEAKHDVEVPEDITALLNPHFEEEIKQRFAVETKPLILTEGPLDVRYIERALDVLGKGELLNSLDIEFVGIEDEDGRTRFGGYTGLNRFRDIYEANQSLFHRPILLLYDCDTQKPNEQVEKLWGRSIPKNAENTKVRKGIENLFPEALFTEKFYSESPTDDGGYARYLDKSNFCDWICENATATDFAKFDSIVQILKEFVEAN